MYLLTGLKFLGRLICLYVCTSLTILSVVIVLLRFFFLGGGEAMVGLGRTLDPKPPERRLYD